MEAALALKGPASWEKEGSTPSSMLEGGSQRSAASVGWSPGRAKEAWEAYVQTNLAPVLASALAINSGSELPGVGDTAALLNLTLEQAQLYQHSSDAARQGSQLDTAPKSGYPGPDPARVRKETGLRSPATCDEALWAALAAAACQTTKPVAPSPAGARDPSQEGCCDARHEASGLHKGSPSLSGDSSDADGVDTWPGTLLSSHGPSSFNGTFRAQRARRTVRVIRSAARPRASGAGTAAPSPAATVGAGTAERGSPAECCSAAELPVCGGSPRRTRKKRAATSLMEGDVGFHTPSSAALGGEDVHTVGVGKHRTVAGSSHTVPGPSTAASSAALSVLQTPRFSAAGLVSPLRSHQIETPSTASSSLGSSNPSQQHDSPQEDKTPSLRDPARQRAESLPLGDAANSKPCWGRPPILLAAATGRADIVRHLLASAPRNPSNAWPADYGRIQQELEEAAQQAAALGTQSCKRMTSPRLPGPLVAVPTGPPLPDAQSLLQSTALHLAALFGHADVAQVLLASPACSVRSRNAQGATALHVAAQEGWTQVVSLLARAPDCDLDACDYGGRTALHLAAAHGCSDVVNRLWSCGCKIEPVDVSGWTALHYAAEAGHTQVVASLVIAGCHVHAGTSAGWTAAHLAAYCGHMEVLQKLLLGGYDVDCTSGTGGWTALHLAAHHRHLQAVNVLLMAGANVLACNTGGDVLHCAAESGCYEVFSRILEVGKSDLEGRDVAGAHLVHSAAKGGNGAILQKLLDLGGDEAAVTTSGRTCLHYAALSGHLDMTEWLLKRGAAADSEDSAGVTPLMLASESGSPELVSLLLAHSANLHACSAAGCTPLHFASCSGSEQVVDLLLERGAEMGVVCQRGTTALHHAAESNRPGVLARLLQCAEQPLVRVKDGHGWTALHHAAMHTHCGCAALLIQAGAELDVQNTSRLTPLHVAARARSLAVARLLLASGCDGSLTDASGRAAVHYAAQTGEWPLFSALHAQPACAVMDPDDRGLTPLHYAVEGGSLDIVGVLLAHLESLQTASWTEAPQSAGQRQEHDAAELDGRKDGTPKPSNSASLLGTPRPDTAFEEQPPPSDPAELSSAGGLASFTPVHVAAYKGHAELIPCLLRAGYPVSSLDTLRRTPLHYAALQGCHAFELPADSLHEPGVAAVVAAPLPPCPPVGSHQQTVPAADCSSTARPVKEVPAAAGIVPEPLCRNLSRHSSGSSCSTAQSLQPDSASLSQPASGAAESVPRQLQAPCLAAAGLPPGPGVWPTSLQRAGLTLRVRVDFPGASELLLAAGVDVHTVDAFGRTALHYAAGVGEHALVEQLLEMGVTMGEADMAGWTPLAWAAAGGHAACVSLLLEAGAGVGTVDDQGRLPLHWAAERGRTHVVALLVPAMLQSGVDLHLRDKAGSPAVAEAAMRGHVECVAQILDNTATAADRGLSALHLAVQDGLELLVGQLLRVPNAVPDSRDKDGLTPLHWAASRGSDAIVAKLLATSADIDAVTNDAWTALHEASLNGHTAVVERLLQTGAQVGLKTSMGLTALHNAASNGHGEVVECLLDAGAAPNARALSNATALFCAAGAGHDAIVRRLLAVGAEVGVAAGAGATALHAAAGAGHVSVVEALLDAHTDVDVQAQNGATALHNAAGGGYDGVVKALLAAKADTDIQNGNCNTALHLAAGKGHVEVVETMLAAGASAHIRNAKGWAAVHSAAAAGQLEVVLRLVAAGAAPRSRPDLDVLRLLTRKTTYRHSYVEGRLRLAEKERQRVKSKNAAGSAQAGPSQEELASLEAQANANMAALLEEEESKRNIVEKKKNKRKDKKKRKGKKGGEKEAEEEGGSADDAKQDEAHAIPSKAERIGPAERQEAAEEDMADRLGAMDLSTSSAGNPDGPNTSGKPTTPSQDEAAQASRAPASSLPAAEGAPRSTGSKSPAKASRPRKQPAGQIEVNAGAKPGKANQAAQEERDASEWQSVRAQQQQRKSRRAQKAQELQPSSASHPPPTNVSQRAQQQQQQPPPPPPRAAPGLPAAASKPTARAAGASKAAASPVQEACPARSQPQATDAKAAAHARSTAATPSFADVARLRHARPVDERSQPAAAGAPDAAPSAAAAAAACPIEEAATLELPLDTGAAAAAQSMPDAPQQGDLARVAAEKVAPLQFGSQPPPLASQHLPHPEATASAALAPISGGRAPPPAAAESPTPPPATCAPPQSSKAPTSGLSALANIWRPGAAQGSSTGHLREPCVPAELKRGNAEAESGHVKAQPQSPPGEGGAPAAAPISAAPAVWRGGMHAHSVDWSFPRNGSGTSLSSLAPQPQANGGSFLDGASDRVTCSSLESSASLGQIEGLLAAEPLGDGSSARSGHNAAVASRLQFSSSPLGHMSLGSGGIHRAAGAAARASPEAPKDYAAVLHDIWNTPLRDQQTGPSSGLASSATTHSTPSPNPPHAGGNNSEVRRMAEAYQLTCPITRELMRDPVVASDGYTYERSAIEAWMASSGVSPRTGQPLKHKDLVPNLTLRASISILMPRSCFGTHF